MIGAAAAQHGEKIFETAVFEESIEIEAITMTSHKGLTGRKATTSNLRNGQLMRAGGM